MKQLLFFISILVFPLISFSQEDYKKGENLIDYSNIKFLKTNKKFGSVTRIEPFKKENATFEIETVTLPKFIYNSATALPIKKVSVKKGRIFLLSFSAKTTKSSLETGEAKVNILFKQSDSYKNNMLSTQSISSKWQKYYVPFQSNININKKDLGIVLHYGFKPQAFQIKDIKFELFPENTDLASLPKTKIVYKGMEADAKWRKDALARIEVIRKGNFELQFTKDGKPVANKNIKIELAKHSFPFGAAINAKAIVENGAAYKHFKKAFDLAVFENDLKIKSLQWDKKKQQALDAISILRNDNVTIKGHVLIWPGFNYLTKEFKKNENNPKKIKELIENHVDNLLDMTKGNISHWDVVNEAYTNRDLQRITGSEEVLYDGFRTLRKKQPNAKGFTNEYGIISKGGLDTKKQEWYYNFVKRIDENTNGLINGIGIQSHIGSDLTPPEKVLDILAYYATLDKQISISEFTMDIQEPKIREQYTRDFMIAAFSHPNVSEFLFWGFQLDERKKVDIYNKDWSIGTMGKAYFSLVDNDWRTRINSKTDSNGSLKGRGFYGFYNYSYMENGKEFVGTFVLNKNNRKPIKIELK
ncbi:endo-1,4-beta-xylanase [Polaribacter haliotis]|uniref:Beta-xylanase n=1 Tax=Polaribacter haliotis TaxID=1888915 RepID=A0A7L8AIZ3_9FLAO|nr:endo-1,4-beta-xylanase [Polaribacter haliotis]QOD61981.1 endo-1,4-beta-xylanase [Polaribacter haliotis]